MDLVGIEPTTSSMPWKRAPSCATGPHIDNSESRRVTAFILAGKNAIVKRLSKEMITRGIGVSLFEHREVVRQQRFRRFFPQSFLP